MKRKMLMFFVIINILIMEGCRGEELEVKEYISVETSKEEGDIERIKIEDCSDSVLEEIENRKTVAGEVESEEGIGERVEISDIDKFGVFNEKLKNCILENVVLKEGTKFENISWIDEEQQCLCVAIQYKEQPEELWFNHLEDYFFFVKEEEIEVLYVDYGTDIDMERVVWAEPDFSAHLEDVNFDGQEDLVIALGCNGVEFGETYCAYLYTDQGYEYCPSFEWQAYNYRVDHENKRIVSTTYPTTGNGRVEVEWYYAFKGNELRQIEIYESDNTNAGIRRVEILDAEEYILKCVADDKEYILDLEGYPEVYFPHLMSPQFGDVTGDGRNDLVLNIHIYGNTVCDTLSDTRVFTINENGLEEILYIEAFGDLGVDKWDDKYHINCGCTISENGELVIDVAGDKVETVIEGYGIVILKYEEGEFIWLKSQ